MRICINLTILTLDLGTTTGFAIQKDERISSGIKNFKATRFQSSDRRYFNFKRWLQSIHDSFKPNVVYYEEVRKHIGVDAAHAYGGFKAILTEWCQSNRTSYEGVHVGTIKKFITGKGNANKQKVIEAVRKRGRFPQDDNEADALAIMYYVLEEKETYEF